MQILLDSTMVNIGPDGKLRDKSQLMADLKAASAHVAKIVNESVNAQVFGDTAVATGVFNEKGIIKGMPYQHRCAFIATWVNRNGAWVCVSRQSTLIKN
jgi:hypothetical protein